MSIASTQGPLELGLNVRALWMVAISGMLRNQVILQIHHSVQVFTDMLQGALMEQYTEVILLATVLQYIVHLMADLLGLSIQLQQR